MTAFPSGLAGVEVELWVEVDAEDPRILAERDRDVVDEDLWVSVGLTGLVRRKVCDRALRRRDDELLAGGPGADSIQVLLQPALELVEMDAGSAERPGTAAFSMWGDFRIYGSKQRPINTLVPLSFVSVSSLFSRRRRLSPALSTPFFLSWYRRFDERLALLLLLRSGDVHPHPGPPRPRPLPPQRHLPRVLQYNCNGLSSSRTELESYLHEENVLVACLQETKLRPPTTVAF